MISYDTTNNQLLMKVNGADSVIPFNKGIQLTDINPDKEYTGSEYYVFTRYGSGGSAILVQGYSKLYLRTAVRNASYSLRHVDGSYAGLSGSFTSSSWVEIEIPSNVGIAFITSNPGNTEVVTYFSIKA